MSESSTNRVLRVLAVDDDSVSLTILTRKLQECGYQVAATTRATEALALLREKQNDYDIVITDIMMPEMDGFKLLEEIVSAEVVIPVIMISSDSNVKTVVKAVKGGAQDYLVKPVQLEDLRQLGEHVMKKPESDSPGGVLTFPSPEKSEEDETSNRYETESTENGSTRRKYRKLSNRIVWTPELHKKFEDAIQQLQADDNSKIIPKNILEIMNEPNLRRENVASHLQKYRRNLMRQTEVTGEESSSSADAAISASVSNTVHPTTNCYSSDGQYDITGWTNKKSRFFEQNGTSYPYLANQNAVLPHNFLHSTSQIVDQMHSAPVSSPMLANIIGVPVQVQTVDPRTRIFDCYTDSSWSNPYVMSRQQIPSVSSFAANNPCKQEYSYPLARIAPNVQPYNALTSNYQMHRGVPNQMLVRPQVDSLFQQPQCSLPGYHDVQNLCASGNFNGESQMNDFAGNEQIRYPELLQENPDKETVDSQSFYDELSALIDIDTVPGL